MVWLHRLDSGPRVVVVVAVLLFALLGCAAGGLAAPAAELWPRWQVHDRASRVQVDHAPWQALLDRYLVTGHPSGINRFRYGAVSPADRQRLAAYLQALQAIPVSRLNRVEQEAYWINLYNAGTVKVILDHYPVASIRDIDISPGWFSDGPWGAKLFTIEGEKVSLNDIEHRILRPIFRDPRLHYAVNCASLGCPNLQPRAFTGANLDELLDAAARAYVNHPRGARLDGDVLHLSSIYRWFQSDFGGNEAGVLAHLRRYAGDALARRLAAFSGTILYHYDWRLNDTDH